MTVKAGNESEEREVMEQVERAGQSLGGRAGVGHGKDPAEEIIERAPGDDVIVAVRMRRSSFEKLTSSDDGHSVPVTAGMIGLVRDAPAKFNDHRLSPDVWTFLVWSSDPVWRGVPEQIPGNALAAAALADDEIGGSVPLDDGDGLGRQTSSGYVWNDRDDDDDGDC